MDGGTDERERGNGRVRCYDRPDINGNNIIIRYGYLYDHSIGGRLYGYTDRGSDHGEACTQCSGHAGIADNLQRGNDKHCLDNDKRSSKPDLFMDKS